MESFDELFIAYICLCLALIANVRYYEYIRKKHGKRDFWKMPIGVLVFDIILLGVLFCGGGIVG